MQALVTGKDQISRNEMAYSVYIQHPESEEPLHKASPLTSKIDLPITGIRFKIPKMKYDEIRSAMHNSVNYFYMIFDATTGLLLRSELVEADR